MREAAPGGRAKGRKPLHLVSAWACRQRLVLGQQATEEKSNEITAIPLLLERLVLKGAIVTIDAMGCQTEIAQTIIDKGGDYCLALKDNRPLLQDEVERFFADPQAAGVTTCETVDKDHGRIEVRRHSVCSDIDWLFSDRRRLEHGLPRCGASRTGIVIFERFPRPKV